MIQLSSVRRLVDVLDVEECDEDGEVGNCELLYYNNIVVPCNNLVGVVVDLSFVLEHIFQAASSLVAIVCRLTEDLRERM